MTYRCRRTFLNTSRISLCSCSPNSFRRKYEIQSSFIICGQCGLVQALIKA